MEEEDCWFLFVSVSLEEWGVVGVGVGVLGILESVGFCGHFLFSKGRGLVVFTRVCMLVVVCRSYEWF